MGAQFLNDAEDTTTPALSIQSECLAAFAVGCLGAKSPAAAGDKLGLMGGATLEELFGVLKHLETLAAQRSAKLAGTGAAVATTADTSLGERFKQDLLAAVRSSSIEELFEHLPHDSRGHADLCRVFGLPPAASAQLASDRASTFEFSADYVEHAQDLPEVADVVWQAASSHLLTGDVSEEGWEVDASAINALRSRLVHSAETTAMSSVSPQGAQLLRTLAQRCSSRRPALAKAALHAIQELASAQGGGIAADHWAAAAKDVIGGCLGAFRGTKVVARMAEHALSAVVQYAASSTSAASTVEALTACILIAVRAKPVQPPVVAAGIQKLAPLVSGLTSTKADIAALAGVKALCEEVLAVRTLGSAFATARAILRDMPSNTAS